MSNIQGKFLLSYNDCDYIRQLYEGYQIEPVARLSNLAQRYEGGCEYPEVLIANYDMEERRKKVPKQLSLFEWDKEEGEGNGEA